jgi:nitronate monooxygenase
VSRRADIRDLLGIELPIVQAPMAGVQGSALAVAVCNAGGLGSLPAAMLSAAALRQELEVIRAQTGKAYNVNFFCHQEPVPDEQRERAWRERLAPYAAELQLQAAQAPAAPARRPFSAESAAVLAEFAPPVVSFHFGLPAADLLERVRSWGGRVLGCATTVAEARWLEAYGADAIVAQGLEAGGHRGCFLTDDMNEQLGTLALLPRVLDAVRTPVIAAGGIADERGVAAALALGASGVQVGTSFLLCAEATTSAVHRAALKSEAAGHTALTNLFSGRPARGIVNRLMREQGPMSAAVPAFPLAAGAVAGLRARAESLGRGDFSPLWAGQNASGCRELPAAQLLRSLMPR